LQHHRQLERQMSAEKIRENRLRRVLQRRGYQLQKSKRRDPNAFDFGGYMIIDPQTGAVVAGGSPRPFSLDLDDVEAWLRETAASGGI
jgi:hypothetical protein